MNPSDYRVLGTGGHKSNNHFRKKNHPDMSSDVADLINYFIKLNKHQKRYRFGKNTIIVIKPYMLVRRLDGDFTLSRDNSN